jgi:hypothetical protein
MNEHHDMNDAQGAVSDDRIDQGGTVLSDGLADPSLMETISLGGCGMRPNANPFGLPDGAHDITRTPAEWQCIIDRLQARQDGPSVRLARSLADRLQEHSDEAPAGLARAKVTLAFPEEVSCQRILGADHD